MSAELLIISDDDTLEPLESFVEEQQAVDAALELWREVVRPFFLVRDERTMVVKVVLMPFWLDPERVLIARCDGTYEVVSL